MDEAEIDDMTKQHLATYDFQCELGTFKLKALSRLEFDEIGKEMLVKEPMYVEYATELDYYQKAMAHAHGELTSEQMDRMAELTRIVNVCGSMFKIACFADPVLTDVEHLEAISSELGIDEWQQLNGMLEVLAYPRRATERERKLAELSVRYNLPISEGMTAENITIQQSALLDEVGKDQEKQMWEDITRQQ